MATNLNPDQPQQGQPAALRCPEAEPLFAGYLDGTLDAATLKRLDAHLLACPECADELKLIRLGKEWLQLLRADDLAATAPAGLAEKILARTAGEPAIGSASKPGAAGRQGIRPAADFEMPGAIDVPRPSPWHQVNMAAVRSNMARTGLLDARLMMTAAMAFFSVSLTLNVVGIRLNDLRPSNLRHTVVRTYSDTNAHVQHYYENMRVVYQLESRVRELRRAAEASDAAMRTTRQPQRRKAATNPGTEQITPQSTPQSVPQSNTRPAPADGVAGRGKTGKKSHADTEPAPPVAGDVLQASLLFPRNAPSPPAERFGTAYQLDPAQQFDTRSEA